MSVFYYKNIIFGFQECIRFVYISNKCSNIKISRIKQGFELTICDLWFTSQIWNFLIEKIQLNEDLQLGNFFFYAWYYNISFKISAY